MEIRVFYANHDPDCGTRPWHIWTQDGIKTPIIHKIKSFEIHGQVKSEQFPPVQGIPRFVLWTFGTLEIDSSEHAHITGTLPPVQ